MIQEETSRKSKAMTKRCRSVEPIMHPFGIVGEESPFPKLITWEIFGAETGNRKEKVIPERSWIEDLVRRLRENGKPVFMKDSMKPVWKD